MDKKNKNKLDKFLDILHEDRSASVEEIRKDIDSAGINMKRIESAVSTLVDDAKRIKKMSWLDEAKQKRNEIGKLFDQTSNELKSKFKDARELANAIKTGQFGVPLQNRANAFFRNQDFETISDADLISFIEDCQLLDELAQDSEEND